MDCFSIMKKKKKKLEQSICLERFKLQDHTPTGLSTPQKPIRSIQSAPSSFKTRSKPVHNVDQLVNGKIYALSAPSSLKTIGWSTVTSSDMDEQKNLKGRVRSIKCQEASKKRMPQSLPLPSPEDNVTLKYTGSITHGNNSAPLPTAAPLPMPPLGKVRFFSLEEITLACKSFSTEQNLSESVSTVISNASFKDDLSSNNKVEATVICFRSSNHLQGVKEFPIEVSTLASFQSPYICKLLGFHVQEGSERRILVYERLFHGSLDQLLHGKSDVPHIDWGARVKIALCSAQGLAFLHEEGPFQAMYSEFSTSDVQVDRDFTAKLSGYGCVSHSAEAGNSSAAGSILVDAFGKGLLTPKSNVWSFGIVLLELLTGCKSHDPHLPKEERALVRLTRPYLTGQQSLSLVMDPKLKGRYPSKAADFMAKIILKCLNKDPSLRPTMGMVVESLKCIQAMKNPCISPPQNPAKMTKSPSLNAISVQVETRPRLLPSPSSGNMVPVSIPSKLSIPSVSSFSFSCPSVPF